MSVSASASAPAEPEVNLNWDQGSKTMQLESEESCKSATKQDQAPCRLEHETSPRSSEYQATADMSSPHHALLSAVEQTVISQLTALSQKCTLEQRALCVTEAPTSTELMPLSLPLIRYPAAADSWPLNMTRPAAAPMLSLSAPSLRVNNGVGALSMFHPHPQQAAADLPTAKAVSTGLSRAGGQESQEKPTKKEQRMGCGRKVNAAQKHILKQHFIRNKKPSKDDCEKIAMEIDQLDGGKAVTARVVEVWFNNRRSKKGDADTDSEHAIDPCNLQTPFFCEVSAAHTHTLVDPDGC